MKLHSDYFDEIYLNLLKGLYSQPSYVITNKSGKQISEFIDLRFTLSDPYNCFATCRNMSMDYLKGELDFYLSGSPFLKDIQKFSKFWDNVTDDGRTVNSNYGKLLFHDRNIHNYTQFEYAKEMLERNLESKKAVMSIYSPANAYKSNDNPCTMYLQFVIRKNRLHLFVKMRSSDVWYGLPYDVPFFVFVQMKMVLELNKKDQNIMLGNYHHQAGSLHLYERNYNQVKEILVAPPLVERDQMDLFLEIIQPKLEENYE